MPLGGIQESRLPRRARLVKAYIGLVCVVIVLLSIAEGYYLYANRDPATSPDLSGLIVTVLIVDARVFAIALLFFGYLLPLFVADFRGHHDRTAIGIVNVAFGWSLVGWLLAGIWALSPTQGFRAVLSRTKKHATPAVAQASKGLERVRREAEQHPLVRDAKSRLDRLLGGKLSRYVPPPEGIESLVADWGLTRDIEGAVIIRARLLLPMSTRLNLRISGSKEEEVYSTQCVLDSGGWLRIGPLTNFGRPYPPGSYIFQLETLPFLFGTQKAGRSRISTAWPQA